MVNLLIENDIVGYNDLSRITCSHNYDVLSDIRKAKVTCDVVFTEQLHHLHGVHVRQIGAAAPRSSSLLISNAYPPLMESSRDLCLKMERKQKLLCVS